MSADPIEYGLEPFTGFGKTIRRTVIVLLTVVVCGFGCWWGLLRSMDARSGMNVTRSQAPIDDLPPDAQSVSYRIGGVLDPRPLIYEFDTSEASFRTWAAAMGGVLKEGEMDVSRFDDSRMTLPRALSFYRPTGADSGWGAAYDLDTGRAYYSSHSR